MFGSYLFKSYFCCFMSIQDHQSKILFWTLFLDEALLSIFHHFLIFFISYFQSIFIAMNHYSRPSSKYSNLGNKHFTRSRNVKPYLIVIAPLTVWASRADNAESPVWIYSVFTSNDWHSYIWCCVYVSLVIIFNWIYSAQNLPIWYR